MFLFVLVVYIAKYGNKAMSVCIYIHTYICHKSQQRYSIIEECSGGAAI